MCGNIPPDAGGQSTLPAGAGDRAGQRLHIAETVAIDISGKRRLDDGIQRRITAYLSSAVSRAAPALANPSQLKRRQAKRDIQRNRPLYGKRLKREASV